MQVVDWIIILLFFIVVLGIGWVASRTAGKNTKEFFLGGRNMPWWLLGISMVACTFSADTPNLVTGMVRENGVAKNWAWWAFLITGMVTVFIYAKLWRRSKIMTDLEFYELRYSGKPAKFLRVFRSLYLGILFNCLIMGTVTLAAIKIGVVMFGLPPWITVVGASLIVVIYASIGGLKGIIWADFFQYFIAMFGAVVAAIYAVKQPEVGGVTGLMEQLPAETLNMLPDFSKWSTLIPLLIIPIAVQWWAVWYPGGEPGGGGYIAQRMLASKNEKNAIGATLFFNFLHYALRPWPWIIVALASILVFKMDPQSDRTFANEQLEKNKEQVAIFQSDPKTRQLTQKEKTQIAQWLVQKEGVSIIYQNLIDEYGEEQVTENMIGYIKNDIAYPAMIKTVLPSGLLGLVIASLIAAYMSTIGTHLNWGSSYFVNDFYKRIVKPQATEKELVTVGRISTISLMIISGIMSLTFLNNATQAFDILLLSGAGTGAIYLLRWFWTRINAWTEIIAMAVATIVSIILVFGVDISSLVIYDEQKEIFLDGATVRLLLAVGITTVSWILTTFLTAPESKETLMKFNNLIHPDGKPTQGLPIQILMVFIGCVTIYCCLFSIGSFIYGHIGIGSITGLISLVGCVALFSLLGRIKTTDA